MMIYLAVLAIQVMLVIDVIRHGRNQLWIMALMFLPGPSTIAYLIIEVYPRLRGNRHVRTAQAKAVAKLDPEREVRAARDALDLADTVANRERLADALSALGRFKEALPLYQEARQRGRPTRARPRSWRGRSSKPVTLARRWRRSTHCRRWARGATATG